MSAERLPPGRSRVTRVEGVFVVSVLVSAGLLFLVQPMLARMLLASYGGSPAVWSTCLVFFQLLLLAGYAYAHGTVHLLGPRRQMGLHAGVLLASLVFLPQMLRPHAVASAWPALSVLLTLAAMSAVPFAVLSTNSSLTQRWFGSATFHSSENPFWLYAASNAGSLVALLAYPLVVEPLIGLRTQLGLWSAGYVAFVALSLTTMYVARSHARGADIPERARTTAGSPPDLTTPRRLSWVMRSAVASSLLLSISMQISTDVLAAPLLWVVPLALYLVTFIVAFSPARPPRGLVSRATMVGIALCLGLVVLPTVLPLWFALLTLLGTLFFGALLCHGDLADDRPPVEQLTAFYLWIAVGGAIGGLLNSIVAPLVFSSVAEYPITLAWLALLLPARGTSSVRASWRRAIVSPAVLSILLSMVLATVFVLLGRRHATGSSDDSILRWQFMPVAVLFVGLLFAARPMIFPLATALAGLFVIAGLHFTDPIIDQGRSFFGVSRVTENATERRLVHGVTVHGAQRKAPALRDVPTSYYYPDGPLGWAVAHAPANAEIGVVGLGAGSLATLARPGQRLTFYEIDPLVETMARRDFSYLADSRASVGVVIGDGRRLVADIPGDHFDLLVLDAFSSDAIPTHLLTEEAIAMYLGKLKPGGLLVVHISNRFADLARVFRGWRARTGQRVAISIYVPAAAALAQGVVSTVAVALSPSPRGLAALAGTGQWYWLEDDGPVVHWTDDHVSLLGVLNRSILSP